ncbi:MAG: IS110 family transposase [Candidatus Dormibacteraeota bacterium]|nr:IS110 family transposase [Candidatus Dormibacteraeota bacterium]
MSVVVGIDVGASQHVAAVCRRDRQRAERSLLRYRNNRSGFEELDHWLQSQGTVEQVVMESSGHYWLPLASHLRRCGVPVAVVNPLEAKYFAKSRLRRTKSDPADARTLAELGVRDQPPAREPLVGVEVREAARFCIRLVEDQARVCQRIRRLVEISFPELGEVFEDPTCETALAVLRQAPTARSAARRHLNTLANSVRPGGRRRLGQLKAKRLQELARQTVAPPELDAQAALEVQLLIEQYDLLGRQIEVAEQRVAEMLDGELARRLQTIPGVGPATAATLMAEIGDIRRFDDVDQVAALSGVHPAEKSSGRKGAREGTSWHMAKTGNPYIRAALYRIAVSGLKHNPVLRQHYAKKRAAGRSPMNAIGHCMAKALDLVWGVWRSDRDFDPNYRVRT